MYRIEYFDDVILPTAMPEDDLGTGDVASGIAAAVGGPVDVYGDRTVLPQRRQIRVKGLYTRPGNWVDAVNGNQMVDESGNLLVWTDPDKEIADRTDSLKRLIGQRKQLWRRDEWAGGRTYLNARLLAVNAVRKTNLADNALEVTALFESSEMWRSTSKQSVSVVLSGASSGLLQVVNSGAMSIYDAVLTMSGVGSTVLDLTFWGNGCSWKYSTFVDIGQTLVIDSGAMSITRAGAGYYSGFALNSAHSRSAWIEISPGLNNFYVSIPSGVCTVTLSYYLQYP